MKERPILFSGPMVRAILEGRKTHTRRVVKPQPDTKYNRAALLPDVFPDKPWCWVSDDAEFQAEHSGWPDCSEQFACPYGKPGDHLWVRETFALECDVDGGEPPFSDGRPTQKAEPEDEMYSNWCWTQPHYRATDPTPELVCVDERHHCGDDICLHPWRPSIHMPRWAARLTLEITDVRVQRLQEISEADARAEGFGVAFGPGMFSRAFDSYWSAINGPGSWEANPWVWAISFTQVKAAA